MPWLLEQCYVIPNVRPAYYNLYWPWLKNNFGTYACGYYNYSGTLKYSWLDQDMKFEMTGKR
jgi:hypothetical protein